MEWTQPTTRYFVFHPYSTCT